MRWILFATLILICSLSYAANVRTSGSGGGEYTVTAEPSGWTDAGANVHTATSLDNVGIGTNFPTEKLEVNGTVKALSFFGDGSALTNVVAAGVSGWEDGGVNVYTTTSTDNVGIGTTLPLDKLDVIGNIRVTSLKPTSIIFEGNTVDAFQTTLTFEDPVEQDGIVLIPNRDGIIALTTGALEAGNYPVIDSNGNLVDSGNSDFGGDFFGPASSSDNAIVRYDGTTGKLGQNSAVTVDDSGNVVATGSVTATEIITSAAGLSEIDQGLIVNQLGGATANDIFRVEGDTDVNLILTDVANNRVGMGTTTPSSKLQVVGTVTATEFVGGGSGLTGISAGSDSGWTDGGTNVYLTLTSDNVGVGTTTPSVKLQVVGTVAATAVTGNGSGLTSLGLASTATALAANGANCSAGDAPLGVDASGAVEGCFTPSGGVASGWTDGGTNVYLSDTSDLVGVGTTSPSGLIEIVESGEPPFMISSDSTTDGDFLIVNSTGNVGIGTTNTSFAGLSIKNGNVGIGTWKPSGILVVMGGNVGIGTTIPSATLNVFKNTATGLSSGIKIINPNSTAGTYASVDYINNAGGTGFQTGLYSSTTAASPNDAFFYNGVTGGGQGFWTGGSQRIYIKSDGNVGIGTASPMNKLQVNGTFQIDNANSMGWSAPAAANQACNTTCTSACVIGFDQGVLGVSLGSIVVCTDATADECICAGPN